MKTMLQKKFTNLKNIKKNIEAIVNRKGIDV